LRRGNQGLGRRAVAALMGVLEAVDPIDGALAPVAQLAIALEEHARLGRSAVADVRQVLQPSGVEVLQFGHGKNLRRLFPKWKRSRRGCQKQRPEMVDRQVSRASARRIVEGLAGS
jgi:hypothetical protein